MASTKRPWRSHYTRDWLADPFVRSLDLETRMIYLELLDIAWDEDGLQPRWVETGEYVAHRIGCSRRKFLSAWIKVQAKFDQSSGQTLSNSRLENERSSADSLSENQRNRVNLRWQKDTAVIRAGTSPVLPLTVTVREEPEKSGFVSDPTKPPEPAVPPAAPLPLTVADAGQALVFSDVFPSQASESLPGVVPVTETLYSPAEHANQTGARVDEQPMLPILSDAMAGPRKRPKKKTPPTPHGTDENAVAGTAEAILSELNAARARVIPRCRPYRPLAANLKEIIARLREGNTADDLRYVIAVAEGKVRNGEDSQWFDCVTPFRQSNIPRYVGAPIPREKKQTPDGGPGRMPSAPADEIIRRFQRETP